MLDLLEATARSQVPQRSQLEQMPAFQAYTPAHQSALLSAFERVPQAFRIELGIAFNGVVDRVAPRISNLMSEEDFIAAAQAFRAPENDALVRETTARTIATQSSDSTFPDLSQTEAGRRFLESQAGQAFSRARPQIDRIVAEESLVLGELGLRLRRIGMTLACDALEDECPASTRQQLGRP